MKIQFIDIKSNKERKKNILYHFVIDPFYFQGDKITVVSEAILKGTLTYENDIAILDVNIKTSLELICSRCLEPYVYPIDIDIKEKYTNNRTILNDEVIFVEDDAIDIIELAKNAIISSLPIKKLCKEDCKGLCPKCGANLNRETCTCNNADVDIRLEGLKALLSDNKEV